MFSTVYSCSLDCEVEQEDERDEASGRDEDSDNLFLEYFLVTSIFIIVKTYDPIFPSLICSLPYVDVNRRTFGCHHWRNNNFKACSLRMSERDFRPTQLYFPILRSRSVRSWNPPQKTYALLKYPRNSRQDFIRIYKDKEKYPNVQFPRHQHKHPEAILQKPPRIFADFWHSTQTLSAYRRYTGTKVVKMKISTGSRTVFDSALTLLSLAIVLDDKSRAAKPLTPHFQPARAMRLSSRFP